MTQQTGLTKLVKKIVVGYDINALPPHLMRSFLLLRGKLARAGFKTKVELWPLIQLPSDVDVLFVPAELEEMARRVAPATHIRLLTSPTAQQPAFEEFMQQLEAGQEVCALRIEDKAGQSGEETIIRYRGYTRVL